MNPGELWAANGKKTAIWTREVKGFTHSWTVSFHRGDDPFILLEKVYDEDGEWVAWMILAKDGIAYTWGPGLELYASRVNDTYHFNHAAAG